MSVTEILFYIIVALVSVIVYLAKRHLSYWKRRGIEHIKPDFPEGNLKGFMRYRHIRDIMKEHYDKLKDTGLFGGFFFFLKPSVVIFDLDLIRNILIKDFNNFSDRGLFYNEQDDPLTGHLLGMDGPKWKSLRNKLSPTFTSAKMKFMFPTVLSVGVQLQETLSHLIEKSSVIEIKDILSRFTVDVIGTCAFGIDCNSLKDPNAEFRIMSGNVFTLVRHNMIIQGLMFSFPNLARKLHMRIIHEDVHKFFMRIVRETVEYREKNSIKRNDFMNLLIELKNSEDGLTIEEIAAQVFIFFAAGFETSSTTLGFALFELANNQDMQNKLRAEINVKLEKHSGELTYECLAEMYYMEKVFKETLRKYTIIVSPMRKALNDYPTSDPKFTIPKGTLILIPADAIHRDPKIYPDPETFDPERFSQEEIQKRHSITWLPFGEGPRNCIGSRFAKMQIYIGLTIILKHYKFHCCEKTPYPLEFDPAAFGLGVKGGVFLRLERI